jgi:hypothetical protein
VAGWHREGIRGSAKGRRCQRGTLKGQTVFVAMRSAGDSFVRNHNPMTDEQRRWRACHVRVGVRNLALANNVFHCRSGLICVPSRLGIVSRLAIWLFGYIGCRAFLLRSGSQCGKPPLITSS